tara:strand:+ start:318 stop:560 length:243 start_codon:yes stop_codon:yes gene_type:complete
MSKINSAENKNFSCLFCGSSKFKVDLDKDGNIKLKDRYECLACGRESSREGMLELCKDEILEQAKSEIEQYTKDLFKRFK